MSKNVKINGASYSDVPAIDVPLATGSGNARFYDCVGSKDITENGTVDVTGLASVNVNVSGGGDAKNVQCYMGMVSVKTTSYSATGVSLTVEKTGTYKVSWMGCRNTNSGTSGSQLYIDGSAYGSAQTGFTNTYGQSVTLSNVPLTAGQTIEVRARARSTSYYMMVGNLCIEQTA